MKLYIKTYGCQMNVYDSERMEDVLAPLGFTSVDGADDADMVILNTCHIRAKAADKVYSELGRLALLKERRKAQGRPLILAVAGCVAQAEGAEILSRAPSVDMVFGPQAYHRLPEMVARVGSERILDTEFPEVPKFDRLPRDRDPGACAAFLTVQEGCDRFCTFCVVPYTRGAEYSRPATDVIDEARRLAVRGVREITLLGQNVNRYHGEAGGSGEWGLGRLIAELAGIAGLERICYTTSYPADMDDELIAAHRDIPQLMPFLHLPVQSGSDRVLAAMNRRHGADHYRRLVDRLRAARPDLALASDFIVGFPGETGGDFRDTLKLVRDIGFCQAYSFKYSPRPGTPAADSGDQVEEGLKDDRLGELQDLLGAQQLDFNVRCVGRTMPALLDRKGRHSGQLIGRSPYMQAVHVDGPDRLLGTIADLEIIAGLNNSLAGAPAGEAAAREPTGVPLS